jgi:RNA polymerase sigma-70 factor (ECF subfamily)
MRRVQADDEAALGALMERWELPVKRTIGRLVFNAGEAEELAQETFVRVWSQRKKFRVTAEFRPWVFSIAVNLARNRLRWWRRRPEISLEGWSEIGDRKSQMGVRGREIGDGESALGKGAVETGERSAERGGGAAVLERKERAAAVRDAVAALPAELRETLVLFEYEELSHAEIAVALGCTVKAVESRLRRAREKLRGPLRRWMMCA